MAISGEGVSAQGDVCLEGCLPGERGEGVSAQGVSLPVHAGIHTHPCEQNDWQTPVKILPCCNYVADGNNSKEFLAKYSATKKSIIKLRIEMDVIFVAFSKETAFKRLRKDPPID